MKIAPLHFKINCLAIQQHELINYGNKFATEIYATTTHAWARVRTPVVPGAWADVGGQGGHSRHPPPPLPV